MIKPITMWFPLSIKPDVVTNQAMHSMECYVSVLQQLREGKPLYQEPNYQSDEPPKQIGTTKGFSFSTNKGDRVFVEIYDEKIIEMVNLYGENAFCLATAIDADGDRRSDGVFVATSCIVLHTVLLAKTDVPSLIEANKDKDDVIICKENTLKLE